MLLSPFHLAALPLRILAHRSDGRGVAIVGTFAVGCVRVARLLRPRWRVCASCPCVASARRCVVGRVHWLGEGVVAAHSLLGPTQRERENDTAQAALTRWETLSLTDSTTPPCRHRALAHRRPLASPPHLPPANAASRPSPSPPSSSPCSRSSTKAMRRSIRSTSPR